LDFAACRSNALAAFLFARHAMRTPPMMSVEVDGQIVRRPAELEVLLYDRTGKPSVSRMRPTLHEGETLHERSGQLPIIVKATP